MATECAAWALKMYFCVKWGCSAVAQLLVEMTLCGATTLGTKRENDTEHPQRSEWKQTRGLRSLDELNRGLHHWTN